MMTYLRTLSYGAALAVTCAGMPAYAQTTVGITSGAGTVGILNTAPTGTQAAPWTLVETISTVSPFVVRFSNPQTEPVGPTSSISGYTYGKWLSLTITNNTASAWSSFDFELQSVLGTPSVDGDGLSFAQGAGLPYTSNRFSTLQRTEDSRDFLNFSGGTVAIGQAVTFNFAITDNQLRNQFWLVQTPNRVVSGVPEPATWALMMLGFGAIGFATRRRPKTAVTIRYV